MLPLRKLWWEWNNDEPKHLHGTLTAQNMTAVLKPKLAIHLYRASLNIEIPHQEV